MFKNKKKSYEIKKKSYISVISEKKNVNCIVL